MGRTVIALLLATVAFVPAAARAQDEQEMTHENETKVTFGGQWQRERAQQRDQARPDRPERQPEQRQPELRQPEQRQWEQRQPEQRQPEQRRFEQRARPEPAPQPQAQYQAPSQPAPRAEAFRQRGDGDRRFDTGQRDQRRADEDRRRADDQRRFADQRRGDDQRRADDDRRRADDQRRVDEDRRRSEAQRRNYDDRRFDDDRGRDRGYGRSSVGAFGRGGFDRSWRDDRRYDWNRYRTSNRNLFRLPRYEAPFGYGYGYRHYGAGVFLSFQLWSQDYWIDDPFDYRLPPVDYPYRWVRYYGDALLVDTSTGYVVDAVYGIFD